MQCSASECKGEHCTDKGDKGSTDVGSVARWMYFRCTS